MIKTARNLLFILLLIFITNACRENMVISDDHPLEDQQHASVLEYGLEPELIDTAITKAESELFINCLIINRYGINVVEQYYNLSNDSLGFTASSISKSILSALTGIAIYQNVFDSIDDPIINYIDTSQYEISDPRIKEITIKQILQMRSGLGNDRDFLRTITSSSNWIATILNSQLEFDPGTNFAFSTAGTMLLGYAIKNASLMNLKDFANKFLFEPAGINLVRWLQDPQGNYLGGTGMYFTSKDFVKFGELALNDGVYQNIQLVPENWFAAATTITEPVLPDEWGALTNRSYGFLWWKGKIQDYDVNLAVGHGGQIIVVFPQLDMVIYISSDPNVSYNISDEHEKTILNFIADYILPAIRE